MSEVSTAAPASSGATATPNISNSDGGAPAPAFYEAFKSEAIRTSPSIQRFADPEALSEAYLHLERRFGIDPNRRLDLPADPKDAAAMDAVWNRLGRPEKPDGYKFELTADATDTDKALVSSYAETAHKLGLTAEQARGAMAFLVEQQGKAAEANAAAFAAAAEAGRAALKGEWGQAYDTRVKEIGAVVAKYGDEALIKELDANGLGNYPNLAKMLSRMVERMQEPGVAGGNSGDAAAADRALTPSQAKAAVRALDTNPALRDRDHPQHRAVVEERRKLLAMAEG
jgi:hypothetical protein